MKHKHTSHWVFKTDVSFRNWTFRPQDVLPPGRIQRFLLMQLQKPKQRRLDVLTTNVTVCICHAELLQKATYLLTYLLIRE